MIFWMNRMSTLTLVRCAHQSATFKYIIKYLFRKIPENTIFTKKRINNCSTNTVTEQSLVSTLL